MPKTYRVYYNKSSEAPRVWMIDEGSHETAIAVHAVRMHGTNVYTRANAANDNDNDPRGWLEVQGELEIRGGVAIIT